MAPVRRACIALGLAGLLAACAWQGPRSITLSRQRLQTLVEGAFPVQRSVAGLADLSLQAPQLSLLPERNRLGAALGWGLTEPRGGRELHGAMALDFGLRYDAEQGAIRMEDVQVRQLDVDALGPAQRALVAGLAPPLVGQLLSGQVLYRLPPETWAQARQRGVQGVALQVLPQGLRIDLGSRDGR